MAVEAALRAEYWPGPEAPLWAAVAFVLGTVVGSFLNVCIYRMPRGLSLVSPPSHCPHCQYRIPWYLNIPLVTWLMLRGRCRNCGAPIAARYFWVELLTGLLFLAVWWRHGPGSPVVAVVYGVFVAGLIAASFIDFEHYIIPDEITLGGVGAGLLASFLVPALHGQSSVATGLREAMVGAAVGAGLMYGVLRLGKLMFGRQRVDLAGPTRVVFSETALHLPDREIPYEEIFYRPTDTIRLWARRVELVDRCYRDVEVRLSPERLRIGNEELDPGGVVYMEVWTEKLVLPREAMGLGDVKFMAAIGAFLGWPAVLFGLMVSSLVGSIVGLTAVVLRRREWSSRMPYGPYLALAAVLWILGGREWVGWWFGA
ncbi:prepilin peptidase [Limisphaera sp. VF-2]|jgi:leader peptidase (prepilin peptidase)/N-methyltransferase|uniref:prepilin peptidase n=1 Tax=Limisphaera sp. VF-2 TaxID=3400418 RepID=UPI001778F88C|nr:prepilin peptidase [Limisphaera sp.]